MAVKTQTASSHSSKKSGFPFNGWGLGIVLILLAGFILLNLPAPQSQSGDNSGGGGSVVGESITMPDFTPETDLDAAWQPILDAAGDAQVVFATEQQDTFTGTNGTRVVATYTSTPSSCKVNVTTVFSYLDPDKGFVADALESNHEYDRPCTVLDFARGVQELAHQMVKKWPALKLSAELWDRVFKPALEDLFEISEKFLDQYKPPTP